MRLGGPDIPGYTEMKTRKEMGESKEKGEVELEAVTG